MRSPPGDQCPITRTEGSLTKAPGVVTRPAQSISWRSIIRTGESVFVPIGSSLIRCGISEPVTKTVRSSTFCLCFGAWLPVGSATTVPANMLATAKLIALEDNSVFTKQAYTHECVVSKSPNENAKDRPFPQRQEGQWHVPLPSTNQTEIELELLS